jgi:hypothetical protein
VAIEFITEEALGRNGSLINLHSLSRNPQCRLVSVIENLMYLRKTTENG